MKNVSSFGAGVRADGVAADGRFRLGRWAGVLAALAATVLTTQAIAQEEETQDEESAAQLDRMVVTGSLIPQSDVETATPITVITAADLKMRGFGSVAEALQAASAATGGVQGSQTSASFTQGAEALSLFGLSPGYVKYLIDGRPMANYPALYNGSETFNNLSGIPVAMVERIEILPGGQSSLYGSDAIAGVVNVILKKSLDAATLTVRAGGYDDGGGSSWRFSLADGISLLDGRAYLMGGLQHEDRDPIWAYSRDLTERYYTEGASDPVASRDFLLYSPFTSYNFADPANCENVSELFDGTEGLQTRPGFGEYCGSMYSPGYRTLLNGKTSTEGYLHGTFEVNDSAELYADFLYTHQSVEYSVGSNYTWWGTTVEWGYYYDPRYDDFFNLQRVFTPEDMGPGGYDNSLSEDITNAYTATVGVRGDIGSSAWSYDGALVRTEYHLEERGFARFADAINGFFQDTILGPDLGLDPYYGAYPTFEPDYAAFYQPISPEDFDSFTGFTESNSRTWNTEARILVANSALFQLPGGPAGLALAAEFADEGWKYMPDPRLLTGEIWGTTSVAGGGDRSRYAATSELRLPIVDMLTVTASGRYDAFDADEKIDSTTYSVGVEFRPVNAVLLRGKFGTAFKAPTLSDLYQGRSGYYSNVIDYYGCSQELGEDFDVATAGDDCATTQFFGTQAGNPDLKPIDADVYSYGIVVSPLPRLTLTADFYSIDISNEVDVQSADQLALNEYYCRSGSLDPNSPTCQAATGQITRDEFGTITEIYTPKINIASEEIEAVIAGLNYQQPLGDLGRLSFDLQYTAMLKHDYVALPGDPAIDLLDEPYYSADPENKAEATLAWSRDRLTAAVYASWVDGTWNYLSRVTPPPGEDEEASPNYKDGKVGEWLRFNASVNYRVLENLDVALFVNNVLDEMPPEDHTYPGSSGAPYNSPVYNVYGRSFYIEAEYRVGG